MQHHHQDLPQALPRGTLLNGGRYRIERELNRGATAVVYAAEDLTQPSQYVALKVMNGPAQVPVKVVKREIAFSAQAKHDNIVRLLDVFAEKTQLVIVWELISGPDLLDLLNEHQGCMPEPMAAFYFCQLLQAVMFMHQNGFCHRDIKPENCMIQRNNHQLKLIDFGLSKHLQSARTRGVGTPDYLSPGAKAAKPPDVSLEMLQVWSVYAGGAQPPYDARAVDAWAMGVLMYLLVTGKYPFEDPQHPNNLPHTIQNVLAGRMRAFPDHVSPGCRQLISNLLRKDPAQRTTLQALTMNEWLLGQACSYANLVGRMELLGPLLVYRQQHAFAANDHITTSLQAQASSTPEQLHLATSASADASTRTVLAGAGMGAMMTQLSAPSPLITAQQQQQQQQPLHPAIFQGWPSGAVLHPTADAPAGDMTLSPEEASMTVVPEEDEPQTPTGASSVGETSQLEGKKLKPGALSKMWTKIRTKLG